MSATIATARRAQAAALRAQADALELEAAALDGIAGGADDLLDADSYADAYASGCSWRALLEAGKRGELKISRAGRKPVVRRGEVDRWLASRRTPSRRLPVSAADPSADEYAALVGGSAR